MESVERQTGNPSPDNKVFEEYRNFIAGISEIIETATPSQWWRQLYRYLRSAEKEIDTFSPALQTLLRDNLEEVYQSMFQERDAAAMPTDQNEREAYCALEAQKVLNLLAVRMSFSRSAQRVENFVLNFKFLDELAGDYEGFKIEIASSGEGERKMLRIYSEAQAKWFAFGIPASDTMWHKGGLPRVLVKILAGSAREIIEAELPPRDIDLITTEEARAAFPEATALGVDDLKDVEFIDAFDIKDIFESRDFDLNEALLGKDGLQYSEAALAAAKTGHVNLHTTSRGIYENKTITYEGVELAKRASMARMIKIVVEGKALSFDWLPLNGQIDLGKHWIYLARRFAKRKDRGDLLRKLYFIGTEMGQVRDDEKDVFAVLDRVHAENPELEIQGKSFDQIDLTRWKSRRFLAKLEQDFSEHHQLKTGMQLVRQQGDTVSKQISLAGYERSPEEEKRVDQEWQNFIQRCNARSNLIRA